MTQQLRTQTCPTCRQQLDKVSESAERLTLGSGVLLVCFYCTAWLRLDADLQPHVLTPQEEQALSALQKKQLQRTRQAIARQWSTVKQEPDLQWEAAP